MNIEGYKIISANIGWDPVHLFSCRRCGKGGYKKMEAVKGHLGNSCPGKLIQKGIQPTTASYNPVGTAQKASLQDYPAGLPATTAVPDIQLSQLVSEVARLRTKVDNEMTHMIADRNQNNTVDGLSAWFEANKGMILLVGGSFLLVWILRDSKCHCDCDTAQSYTRSTRNGRRDNNNLNSMLGTAGTYLFKKGVDKVLK